MEQNIFDNQHFFDEYKEIRDREVNFNNSIEQPAMQKMIPDLKGKTVLDMGCGYGYNCLDFIRKGAKRVVGIDISEKMLNVAKSESAHPDIEYGRMNMTDISALDIKFDFVYSSLAVHYVEDFKKLTEDIFNILNSGGVLLFSQESPLLQPRRRSADITAMKTEIGSPTPLRITVQADRGRMSGWIRNT